MFFDLFILCTYIGASLQREAIYMNELWDVIYKKLNNKVSVEDIKNKIEIQKLLKSYEFFKSLKKSLVGVVDKDVIEDVGIWEIINEGEVDLNLGLGKKIKIFLKHKDVGEKIVRKGERLKDYWLVVCGGVSKNNELGYFLRGCSGEDVEGFEGEEVKGKNKYKVLDFGKMRNINLVRRIVVDC